MQTTLPTDTAGPQVLMNASGMPDWQVRHKVREYSFAPGLHLIQAQNRYGDGVFFYDWKPTPERPEALSRDWNILVEVQ